MPQPLEEKSQRKLELLRKKEEEESTKILAEKYNLPYLDIAIIPLETDALKILTEEQARKALVVIFQSVGRHLKIGAHNPSLPETIAILKQLESQRYTYDLFLISLRNLNNAFEFYKKVPEEHEVTTGAIQIAHERLETLQKEIQTVSDAKKRIEAVFSGRTTELLEIILAGALATDASDIHIEPQEEKIRLRFRLDGVLYDVTFLPRRLYPFLLSRIKLVSELKLNIHDRAQDGRFTIKLGDAAIEVRASTLPGPQGENIVLRILNPKSILVKFEDLGMQSWVSAVIENELKKPNGMILTTGPTGSGKTTTLYTLVRKMHTPQIKIITIEDPIEYHLEGIEQTQVDAEKGYDFSNGLRSIVRQDPDVILVGEIRDLETAETAMHASLTGHLVFSTLHTNNAAGTIPRLLDLGVKPAIIAPAINLSMAQRLVRRLCDHCKEQFSPDSATHTIIEKELKSFPAGVLLPEPSTWRFFKAHANGCASCNQIGYKGRIGVYEIILIDDRVEQLILKQPSEAEIKKEALRQSQITMRQDAILKVLAGITDLEEVERVVGAS